MKFDYKLYIKKLITKVIGFCGYQIIRKNNIQLPIESSENDKNILELVRPYTMTSSDRVWSLLNTMNYINKAKIMGDIVECGVWRGGSAMVIASKLNEFKCLNRKLWLYDTFKGMTEPSEFDVEAISNVSASELLSVNVKESGNNVWCIASKEDVINNLSKISFPLDMIELIEGDVCQTLKNIYPKNISLLRLDTDWYESTYKELEVLFPLLSSGGVCIIDDYGHWQGAKKAVDEYLNENNIHVLLHKIDVTGRVFIKP
jgi:O-methyltransferase